MILSLHLGHADSAIGLQLEFWCLCPLALFLCSFVRLFIVMSLAKCLITCEREGERSLGTADHLPGSTCVDNSMAVCSSLTFCSIGKSSTCSKSYFERRQRLKDNLTMLRLRENSWIYRQGKFDKICSFDWNDSVQICLQCSRGPQQMNSPNVDMSPPCPEDNILAFSFVHCDLFADHWLCLNYLTKDKTLPPHRVT